MEAPWTSRLLAAVTLVFVAASIAPVAAGAQAGSGSWSSTGPLAVARADHTATLLPNGMVLVAGGENAAGTPVGSAELFNPVTGQWSSTGALTAPRADHTATLLTGTAGQCGTNCGKVLVTGGETVKTGEQDAILNSAEIYDPASGTWTPTTTPMSDLRTEHTATLLQDGTVLVAGGRAGTVYNPDLQQGATIITDTFEFFDPATGTFNPDPVACCMESARAEHTATLLPDGKVLAAGRTPPNPQRAGLFAGGAWTATGSLTVGRTNHTATLLSGTAAQCAANCGKVLVAGGSNDPLTELYAAEAWSATGALATPRTHHTATLLPNGMVLVVGGHDAQGVSLPSAEAYDPALATWSLDGALSKPRTRHTATLLSGTAAQCGTNCGKVLFAGGSGDNTAELYTPPGPAPADTTVTDGPSGKVAAPGPGPKPGRTPALPLSPPGDADGCLAFRPGVGGKRLGPARLGLSRRRHRRAFKGARSSGRRGIDRYCIAGGGELRIGYPTARLMRALANSKRRRMPAGAVLILTTSARYSVMGVEPGSSVRTLRRRLRGEQGFRVGANVWFLAPAGESRLVFRTRGGRVVELGLADKRLTRARRAAKHLLSAWRL